MSESEDTLLDATLTLQKLRVSAAADDAMWSPEAKELEGSKEGAAGAAGAVTETHRSPARRRKVARHAREPLRASRTSSSDEDEQWALAPCRPSPASDRENAPPRALAAWPQWSYDWDAPALAGRQASGRIRTLLLIRHGQYDSAPACDERRVLTPLGRSQASATGRRLRMRLAALGVDAPSEIVHSTMARAVETAMLIKQAAFPEATLMPDPALREGAPCVPDPNWWQPAAEDVRRDGPRIEAAFSKYFHRDVAANSGSDLERTPTPSASSDATVSSSSEDTSSDVAPAPAEAPPFAQPDAAGSAPSAALDAGGLRGRCAIIVCHGNVIRYCALRALQLPPEAWLRLILPHGSITTVTITADGDALLTGLGDAGHLPAPDVTT